MSIEVVLLVTNTVTFLALLATLGVHVWTLKNQNTREEKYIQAVLSKDIQEYSYSRAKVNNETSKLPVVNKEPDYVPESELTDDEFFGKIEAINENFNRS